MIQKFKIGICTFSYGGNGGISSEVPDIREWIVPLVAETAADDRISDVRMWNLSDTPITMTRNRAVVQARQHGIDILVMVDSDMKPDINFGSDPTARKFFTSSLDFLIDHYHKGPVVIGVPYCGPPPNECVYVFRWNSFQSEHPNPDFQLEMYDRHTAVKMAGIQECAALPTGLIMYDMRCFELTEPKQEGDHPWFYYEWKDRFASEKASTEDVTNTRDISLVGVQKLGYNPVFCNWDAWAGHWKPKCVGKPSFVEAASVCSKLRESWQAGYNSAERIVELRPSVRFPAPINQDAWGTASPGKNHHLDGFNSLGMDLPELDARGIEAMLTDVHEHCPPRPTHTGYLRPLRIVEIGSWAGRSAIIMARHAESLKRQARVFCVDHWNGNVHDDGCKKHDGSKDPYSVFLDNTSGYRSANAQSVIIPIRSDSKSAADGELDRSVEIDMVYIDAEHDYDSVKSDIQTWKARRPTYIGGHDWGLESVRKAVADCGITPKVIGNVWWARLLP